MVKHLTQNTFDAEVFQSKIPVLVDFWAPRCVPCRMVGPIVEELAEDLAGKALVTKVNVDEQEELASRFAVMSIPTIMIVKNGEIVFREPGARDKEEMRKLLGV